LDQWEYHIRPYKVPEMAIDWMIIKETELLGGLEHVLCFHILGCVIIPTDELIVFRGVGQPPTGFAWIRPNVDDVATSRNCVVPPMDLRQRAAARLDPANTHRMEGICFGIGTVNTLWDFDGFCIMFPF
jgi:hypothetical protein